MGFRCRFRPQDIFKSDYQTLWKSGGSANGVAYGITNKGGGSTNNLIGIGGNSGSTQDKEGICRGYLVLNEWFTIWATPYKIVVQREFTNKLWGKSINVNAGNGSSVESLAFCKDQSPWDGSGAAGGDYFKGEIDYVRIWDDYNDMYIPSGYSEPLNASEMMHLGTDIHGLAGFTLTNTPTANSNYYSFNGVDNGLTDNSDRWDESNIDIKVKVRINDKSSGSQTFWKSGGYVNGFAVGIDASGNLGAFTVNSGTSNTTTIPSSAYSNDTWYNIYVSQQDQKVYVENDTTSEIVSASGTINATNGTSNESVGYSEDQCPITGKTSGSDSYFKGDIAVIEIYFKGNLVLPT
ncbi:MAG: hypothetical protein DRP08_06850, partial [Candidatus Aenigmatarchaeota archaeon]